MVVLLKANYLQKINTVTNMNFIKNIRLYTLFIFAAILAMMNSCKKEKEATPAETSTVTDIDGNVYKTVKIGEQWWMAENLRVTKFNDGSTINYLQLISIPTVVDTTWANKKTSTYCFLNNDIIKLTTFEAKDNYGALYNWYAVNDNKKIAPAGWHIPSDDEWKTLEKQLGMSQAEANKTSWRGTDQGNKLKIKNTEAWTIYSDLTVWGNNQSGFNATAGACVMFNGAWGYENVKTGFWWSSSLEGNNAWYRHLDYKYKNVFRYYGPKTYGFSVRCVKD
jgi:uncharacterized protein (TIGR02145 family)